MKHWRQQTDDNLLCAKNKVIRSRFDSLFRKKGRNTGTRSVAIFFQPFSVWPAASASPSVEMEAMEFRSSFSLLRLFLIISKCHYFEWNGAVVCRPFKKQTNWAKEIIGRISKRSRKKIDTVSFRENGHGHKKMSLFTFRASC